MPEDFETNLLKVAAATNYFIAGMIAAREMYGKSYFSLGIHEKAAVDQVVLSAVGANYQAITPEMLQTQAAQSTVGFQTQAGGGADKT